MFSFFKKGLAKIGGSINAAINKIADRPDATTIEELEELLYGCDLGPEAIDAIIQELKKQRQGGRKPVEIVREILAQRLDGIQQPLAFDKTTLTSVLIVGINGVGKTTTVAKLAHNFKSEGFTPLIGSADTFRAAANEQLETWAKRADVPMVSSRHGADPASVAYDALDAAKSRSNNLLFVDTAGRLHTKEVLMEQLGKIVRAMKKVDETAPTHRWLVLDGSLGLNSLHQAEAFTQATDLTGIIITKLDGSAKAGFLVPLYQRLKLPVYFAGLGEQIDDLKAFDVDDYLDGLLGQSTD